MTTEQNQLYRRAFIDPIRTVMLIDDRFPTLEEAVAGKGGGEAQGRADTEWQRAQRLWRGCRDRHWICDLDNHAGRSEGDTRRIAGSDLIVLDYQLNGGSDEDLASRKLISELADHPHTNLVVVYTSEEVDRVQKEIMAFLARPRMPEISDEMRSLGFEEYLDDVMEQRAVVELDAAVVRNFLAQRPKWGSNLKKDLGAFFRDMSQAVSEAKKGRWSDRLIEHAVVRFIRERYAVPNDGVPRLVEAGTTGNWISCGNVFVTVLQKPLAAPHDEAGALIEHLERALSHWEPSPLFASVAYARAEVTRTGLASAALALPSRELVAGWWYTLISGAGTEGRHLAAENIARDLMDGVATSVATKLSDYVLACSATAAGGERDRLVSAMKLAKIDDRRKIVKQSVAFELNHFLSCAPEYRGQLACGTVFFESDSKQYYVCVTPACDMVNRCPDDNYHWMKSLHPWRPMVVMRLKVEKRDAKKVDAFKLAHRAEWLFIRDGEKKLVLATKPQPDSAQVSLETMLVKVDGPPGKEIPCQRLTLGGDDGDRVPTTRPSTLRPIAQLRAPYAEQVLALAGRHLSRIGTDYVGIEIK